MTLTAYGADDPPSEHLTAISSRLQPIDRATVSADAVTTAQRLLGTFLVRDDERGRRVVRIVETEAYAGPQDRASHARAGATARTTVMFGPPGHAYVYLVYGLHHCLNVVCGSDGAAAAVLVRAVEPVAGLARMRACRGLAAGTDTRLAAGPARTCQALEIDRGFSGIDLLHDDRLWLADRLVDAPPVKLVSGTRIGVEYAGPEWAGKPWRFGVAGSPALSKPFSQHT